ncbi:MAG: acVLRF1 family peptidyl-tRNA hydrolase [Kineosporiaceae bacterium]
MAASPSRTVSVEASRLARWVAGFGERHGGFVWAATASGFVLDGADGERAEATLPYLPWPGGTLDDAAQHLAVPRRTLVLIVRRGGYACAVVHHGADGGGVTASKVGSRHVQGRTAAGGWSQQRFARRRAKQADELVHGVVEHAVRLLLPAVADGSTWLATGGDKPLVRDVLDDPRLTPLTALPAWGHLAVGDPDRRLVDALPTRLTAVPITLSPPSSDPTP